MTEPCREPGTDVKPKLARRPLPLPAGLQRLAPVTGTVVVDTFLQASNTYGLPASTLTGNGRACTARSGGAHRGEEILAVTDTSSVTVVELRTGEVLTSTPPATTGGTKKEARGRWPGLPVTYDATQLSHMSRLTTGTRRYTASSLRRGVVSVRVMARPT
jgi:hypothetical protein